MVGAASNAVEDPGFDVVAMKVGEVACVFDGANAEVDVARSVIAAAVLMIRTIVLFFFLVIFSFLCPTVLSQHHAVVVVHSVLRSIDDATHCIILHCNDENVHVSKYDVSFNLLLAILLFFLLSPLFLHIFLPRVSPSFLEDLEERRIILLSSYC